MGRKQDENLVPLNKRTKSEQRKIQEMGGAASGKARREKSAASEVARMILSGNIPVESAKTLVKKMGLPETELNVQAAIIAGQAFAAMKGNHKAAEFVLALVGESPTDQASISAGHSREELRTLFREVDDAVQSDPSKIFNEQAPPDDDR